MRSFELVRKPVDYGGVLGETVTRKDAEGHQTHTFTLDSCLIQSSKLSCSGVPCGHVTQTLARCLSQHLPLEYPNILKRLLPS